MKILFLDLASHLGLIACVTEDAIVSAVTVDHRVDDQVLVGEIAKCLKEAEWTYQDLEQLACVIGPGGFTSLRVGVASANTLAFALKIPTAGIHLKDLYAARSVEKDVAWAHSTKKTEVFLSDPIEVEPKHLTIVEAVESMPSKKKWCGELLPEHRAAFADHGNVEAPMKVLIDVLPEFLAKQVYKEGTLEPWYGRGW